jgi:hypothetical protein
MPMSQAASNQPNGDDSTLRRAVVPQRSLDDPVPGSARSERPSFSLIDILHVLTEGHPADKAMAPQAMWTRPSLSS